jgi:hypothetical protein
MMRVCAGAALLLCALGAQAQEIGRLFTTAAERAALERVRHARPGAPVRAEERPAAAEPVPAPLEGEQILVVNGVVRRSGSGRETTWIDSVPHSGNARLPGGAALAAGHSASRVGLTLRSGKVVSVKPGQSIDAVTGKIREPYQGAPPPKPRQIEAPQE